jgi:hypothetical protein
MPGNLVAEAMDIAAPPVGRAKLPTRMNRAMSFLRGVLIGKWNFSGCGPRYGKRLGDTAFCDNIR